MIDMNLVEEKGRRGRERREEGAGFDGASPQTLDVPEETDGGDWVFPVRLREALTAAVDLCNSLLVEMDAIFFCY